MMQGRVVAFLDGLLTPPPHHTPPTEMRVPVHPITNCMDFFFSTFLFNYMLFYVLVCVCVFTKVSPEMFLTLDALLAGVKG